jgi:hypothetical protein
MFPFRHQSHDCQPVAQETLFAHSTIAFIGIVYRQGETFQPYARKVSSVVAHSKLAGAGASKQINAPRLLVSYSG